LTKQDGEAAPQPVENPHPKPYEAQHQADIARKPNGEERQRRRFIHPNLLEHLSRPVDKNQRRSRADLTKVGPLRRSKGIQ
jgi:hypothetical protein